jgi:hypothetical protein
MTRVMEDWLDTRVGFELEEEDGVTTVAFYHAGWNEASEHFRVTAFCWAMYLRILRRGLAFGEIVAYEDRLDA